MSTPDAPKPLAFPDVPPFLLVANVPRETVPELLGPPALTDWVDGLGNADFWAFEYPCGLQVAFQFLHASEGGLIFADSPEIDHILRHIPFDDGDCAQIDDDTLQSQLNLLLAACPERQPEIDALHSFQVWRQGSDGISFAVGSPTSERDAKCLVAHFESLGHQQQYWYSDVDAE